MLSPAAALADDGPLAKQLEKFAARRGQQEMAEVIFQALSDGKSIMCEAGTGTGKTFAYLVPALLTNQKFIISTGTRHLQDQLFGRDLPLVQKALGTNKNVSLLKGRANYLCLHRLEQQQALDTALPDNLLAEITTVSRWAAITQSGEIDEIIALSETSPTRMRLTSTVDNCLAGDCDFFQDCFVLKARQRAQAADIVVVNHHLFMADMALKEQGFGELLPITDAVIFDEAHQLPELAAMFFSSSLSSGQLWSLQRDTQVAITQEGLDITALQSALLVLEQCLSSMPLADGAERRMLWQDDTSQAQYKAYLHDLLTALQKLLDNLAVSKERGKLLEACYSRCLLQYNFIEHYLQAGDPDVINWLVAQGERLYLHATPANVAASFSERLLATEVSCLFTSATLAINGDFSHFSRQLGLENKQGFVWHSPFDFKQRALLYLPTQLPPPSHPNFVRLFVQHALQILNYSEGHAFVLFTSHQALREAAELFAAANKYPLFIQGQAPKTELLSRFKRTSNALLLGTHSFWEGVDIKGPALRCVMIDKLPFQSPDDPLLRARLLRLAEQGHNGFISYQLPQAIIGLKQGAGRLIRGHEDYGVLVIGDNRIAQKSYGKHFLQALPPMPVTDDPNDVMDFFAGLNLSSLADNNGADSQHS